MSLIEKLCKELGVEVGEEWLGNDGKNYYINYHGQLCSVEYKDNLEEDEVYRPDDISRVLSGELKPAWKPKVGETYYMPSLSMESKYIDLTWVPYPGDYRNYERNIVFKTKEEAIEMANKIMEFLKEERQNG